MYAYPVTVVFTMTGQGGNLGTVVFTMTEQDGNPVTVVFTMTGQGGNLVTVVFTMTGQLPPPCDFNDIGRQRIAAINRIHQNFTQHPLTKKYKKYDSQNRNSTLFIRFMLLFIYLLLYSLSNIKRMIIYEDVTINWLRTVFEI